VSCGVSARYSPLAIRDRFARLAESIEPVGIQAFISEAAVEAFDEGVLRGAAWTNEMEAHTAAVRPLVESIRYELRTVVDHDRLRVTELGANFVEKASNAGPADASFYDRAR
jgi:hypothetical protein